jgi:hypothetical protein
MKSCFKHFCIPPSRSENVGKEKSRMIDIAQDTDTDPSFAISFIIPANQETGGAPRSNPHLNIVRGRTGPKRSFWRRLIPIPLIRCRQGHRKPRQYARIHWIQEPREPPNHRGTSSHALYQCALLYKAISLRKKFFMCIAKFDFPMLEHSYRKLEI